MDKAAIIVKQSQIESTVKPADGFVMNFSVSSSSCVNSGE